MSILNQFVMSKLNHDFAIVVSLFSMSPHPDSRMTVLKGILMSLSDYWGSKLSSPESLLFFGLFIFSPYISVLLF